MAWTLPNTVTVARLTIAVLLFVLLALAPTQPEALDSAGRSLFAVSMAVFLVAALSDALDGWLARRYNLISAFGRIADPFVDKVLVCGTFVFCAANPLTAALVPAWFVVVVLGREFLVTALRGYIESLGRTFPADNLGKLKMVLQCVAIAFLLFHAAHDPRPHEVSSRWTFVGTSIAIWGTLILTVISGVSYVYKGRRELFA